MGVIGDSKEFLSRPGHDDGATLSVTAASFGPGVSLSAFHMREPSMPEFPGYNLEEAILYRNPHLILLGTHGFDMEQFLVPLDASFPAGVKVGGIAGGKTPALFADGRVHYDGCVGLALSGVHMDTVTSQGTKGVTAPATVTKVEGSLVIEVNGGIPASVWLRQQAAALPSDGGGILIGVSTSSMSPHASLHQGPYMIRPIVAAHDGGFTIGGLRQGSIGRGDAIQIHTREGP